VTDGPADLGIPAERGSVMPATVRFYEAVLNGGLSHNGDRQLAQPVANCLIQEDASGARLSKLDKNSPRRIDAPVAAVMAFDRATSVAETSGPAIVRVRCRPHLRKSGT
jgi:phage terminase large subunit-like protein